MSPANKAHFESEKEAIHLILTGIGDEIYSTVDARQTDQEMWEAIERLQHGESLNIQDPEWSRKKLMNRAERLARNANPFARVATAHANQDPYYQTSKSQKSYAPSSKPSVPTRSHTTTRYKGKKIAKLITPPSELASEENSDLEQAQRDKDMPKNLALITKYFKKIYKPTNNNLRTSSNSRNKNVDTTPRYKNNNQCGQFRNQRTMKVVGARENTRMKRLKAGIRTTLQLYGKDSGVERNDSNVIPDSPDMCDDDIQNDQNDVESDNERVTLANLIAYLKLDVDENKKIQNQLKKANTTLARELKECKIILAKTCKTLREYNSVRDSCLIALQNKQTEFEKYKAFNDRTIDYDKLELKEKHDELIKQSLLTKSHYEGLVKHKQRNQSIQTIHMMAPKVPTYNGRPTFANPRYLKQAQSEIPCLYAFPYGQSTYANTLIPDGEETLVLERESQSKLNKVSDIKILIHTCLMPLALKTHNDSFIFVHELKQEMHADLKYVESIENEIDELESDKVEFSNMYDMILQECVSNEFMCTYLLSLSNLDALAELQCLYLHKVKECDYLAQKLSKQTAFVSNEVHTELLQHFAKVEKHSIFLEIALQKCKERVKNDRAWNEQASNVFEKNDVNHKTNVSRPQHRRNQLKDKVVPNNSQVKLKKTQVEEHPRIPSIYNKIKSVTVSNDSLNSKTSNIVQLILFIVDSGCTKHMMGNLKLLCNFVEKFLGTVRFGNDQFTPIIEYGDLVQGNIMINMVYYVEGLNHNLFSVGQFCDADLEVAFWKSTCFVRNLQGNYLLTASPTQAWSWHRILSHLNFNYINLLSKKDVVIGLPKLKYVKDQLCSSCEVSKEKRSSFKLKVVPSSKGRLNLLHIDLCGPMRVASINGKKYILVIVDDYSRYTWTLFLCSKDETPGVVKEFLTMIQRNFQASVITVRIDRGTEFLNKTLHAFFKEEGIEHQTSTSRTPDQNGVVERRNRTLVEAARMMLSASKLLYSFRLKQLQSHAILKTDP
uniref:Integrase catalytic domain-containing protein n=1 Tax=Tanacetum cinerariifolium TaxID=118510 RepID=A0A6L2JNB6_TANCI|nr:hypothetical protein [Tanacetum cinerariifolium]